MRTLKDSDMERLSDFSSREVLEFYKKLPFNFASTAQEEALLIKAGNHAKHLAPCMDNLLRTAGTVLDIGCGPGWLANTISHYYSCAVTGIDFNPVAVERAQNVSALLGNTARFQVADLFTFDDSRRYDLVLSIGVLHHTQNCMAGLRKACEMTTDGGHIVIGLYHKYGRKPFLEHFAEMIRNGATRDVLFQRYREIDPRHQDMIHAQSWFEDQVLHPHETQHTLREVQEVFDNSGINLISTSINKHQHFESLPILYEMEIQLEQIGRSAISKNTYYPGFFVTVGKK